MRRTSLYPVVVLIASSPPWLTGCTQPAQQQMTTVADAREHPAQTVDNGDSGDSPGDLLSFDQPLLDINMNPIGRNSGSCIRTREGHSYQCQWTLTLEHGTIQVAGREYDQGSSTLSIVGGTGRYYGIAGEMESINNNNGTFTQNLRYHLKP